MKNNKTIEELMEEVNKKCPVWKIIHADKGYEIWASKQDYIFCLDLKEGLSLLLKKL